MLATLALLTNRDTENAVNHLAWEVNLKYHTDISVRRLPPHISLKQPFSIGDRLTVIEDYIRGLACAIAPFSITLNGFYTWENIFAITVDETPRLRSLHERLNRELSELFDSANAAFDGKAYRFHVTVASGNAPASTYRLLNDAYAGHDFTTTFITREIALFVYNEYRPNDWQYMVHTVLPITGHNDHSSR